MDPIGFIVFFICIWWVLFYMALPLGPKADFSTDDGGAPQRPRLVTKAVWVTAITTAIMLTLIWFDFGVYLDRFINGEY